MRRFIALSCLSLLLAFPAPSAIAATPNVTVLELFTTRLCMDTPPADNLFAPVAQNAPDNMVALTCHLTSFDNETARDPYSRGFCDDRLEEYEGDLIFGITSPPRLVINGLHENKGNTDKIMQSSVAMGKATTAIVPVQLDITENTLEITMPQLRLNKRADIWIFAYKDTDHISITEGPNAGQDVTYSNIALFSTKLENWRGEYMNLSFALKDMPDEATGYAVIAQYRDFSGILAAAKIDRL